MKRYLVLSLLLVALVIVGGCSTAYQAKPLPFKTPSGYSDVQEVGGVTMAAEAFVDPKKAEESFGFAVRGAGFPPVQVIFDNQGAHPLEINGSQSFLEDLPPLTDAACSFKTIHLGHLHVHQDDIIRLAFEGR